ncbi:MAG: hypothetical protein ACRC5H_09015, partial [Treponemataceae bacterium]
EEIFQNLEDHWLTQGTIEEFISKSINEKKISLERLQKYENILISVPERNLFRRALLAANNYNDPNVTFGAWHGNTYADIHQNRYHLCRTKEEWQESFKAKSISYFKLFDCLLEDKTLQDVINNFTNKENPFYYMIKNPDVLKYSKNKLYTFDWEALKIGYILKKQKVMKDNCDYYLPITFFALGQELKAKFKDEYCLIFDIFELCYNYLKHPQFGLWIKKEYISKIPKGWKKNDEWYYIDNLKDKKAVLNEIENIKAQLS